MITDPFRGFRASQNLRAYGCSRHFCTFTSNRISQVFTKFPYQERIQIIFLTCGRGSRWYWFCGHGWPYLGWCGSPMVRQILLSMGHRYVKCKCFFQLFTEYKGQSTSQWNAIAAASYLKIRYFFILQSLTTSKMRKFQTLVDRSTACDFTVCGFDHLVLSPVLGHLTNHNFKKPSISQRQNQMCSILGFYDKSMSMMI